MIKRCLLMICPRGPRYSQVSDLGFETYEASVTGKLIQISKELYANWAFNAKSIQYTADLHVELGGGGSTDTVVDDILLHSYKVINGLPVFADDMPFPNGYGESGNFNSVTDIYEYADYDLNEYSIGAIWFAHRDNWYLFRPYSLYLGDPGATFDAKCTMTTVTTTEERLFAGDTYTYTRKWTIADKFYI